VGAYDGRFTEEHRVRMVRWTVRELAETIGRIEASAEAARREGADGSGLGANWSRLRRTIEPWLADAERRTRGEGTGAN
jgi:hypothetical protein